jgi:hypothetical protein
MPSTSAYRRPTVIHLNTFRLELLLANSPILISITAILVGQYLQESLLHVLQASADAIHPPTWLAPTVALPEAGPANHRTKVSLQRPRHLFNNALKWS